MYTTFQFTFPHTYHLLSIKQPIICHYIREVTKQFSDVKSIKKIVCFIRSLMLMKLLYTQKIVLNYQHLSLRKGLSSLGHFLLWLLHGADLFLSLDFGFVYCYCVVAP